jgi:FixJ family two-component response regulator
MVNIASKEERSKGCLDFQKKGIGKSRKQGSPRKKRIGRKTVHEPTIYRASHNRTRKISYPGYFGGKTIAEIADELHISKHTIPKHISLVYKKLKVKSRNELTRMINGR